MYQYHDEAGQHLHELDGKPLLGTSTVVSVIAKPLTWWASGLACEVFGWIKKADPRKAMPSEVEANELARQKSALAMLERFSGMTPQEYVALGDKAYRAHADSLNKSADKGTDMHADLEAYVKRCIAENEGKPIDEMTANEDAVAIFAAWAGPNVTRFIVSEGHCYSERLWTGGITDCIAELNDGRMVIIDFKSSKEAYLSQFIQVAGYDIETGESGIVDNDGNPVLKLERPIDGYIIFPFGAAKVEPQFQWDTEAMKRGFEAAVVLYKLINNN